MAWEMAGYGIAVAVLVVAVAIVIGIMRMIRSLRCLDDAVANIAKEAEASLQQCRQLAEEAKEAIVDSRQSLRGFVTIAEGARALGEAAQTAAQTAVHVTGLYREYLTAPFHSLSDTPDQKAGEMPDLIVIGRKLWSMLKSHSGKEHSSDSCQSPGSGADPSEGE